ncbi:ribosomal protection-like ABC-F family protein [Cohnella caldifontis]|uniref:ribosomal protection-like ABC-F family protein n=1 Tax=Cohnella caldifontis TaxID=3027471 RepID=UPI0023EDD44A|nr:ABC-F type ribosomal protection protein [Cohnella sp. YIM B05605]
MFIVKLTDVRKEWSGTELFRNVTFEIRGGERAALFGRNGAGKTTLLGIIRGAVEADGGTVQRGVGPEDWGWLDQHPIVSADETTIGYVRGAKPDIAAAREKMRLLEHDLHAASAAGEIETVTQAAERYGESLEAYEALGGYAWETETERALQRVGLPPETWELPFVSLSGGQQTRAGIARLAALRPKVLTLDEPTNHLDMETIDWLQNWVRDYPGTVIMVSHDRAFLDAAADRIVELTPTGTMSYKGNYTAFREQKELERKTQMALYRKQELEKEAIVEAIRMYSQWYAKASRDAAKIGGAAKPYYAARANKHTARYHAKEKELERLEKNRVEKPRDAEQLRVAFREGTFEAKTLLQATDLAFRYEGREQPVLRGGSLTLNRGDKLAVVGPNGAGKTTLLKLLLGELAPTSGAVVRHPALRIGYFSQQLEHLDGDETVLDSLLRVPDMTMTFARTILGCFLFSGDAAFKRIADLSMGERCRVAFLQLYFSGANLLVLDEPTNYLDIDTRERMEEALAAYPGALAAVSHDRYFLRKVANRVVSLDGRGGWTVFDVPYREYESSGGRSERGRTEEERERDEALRLAEWERTALMAKEELNAGDRSRLEELRQLIAELTGEG